MISVREEELCTMCLHTNNQSTKFKIRKLKEEFDSLYISSELIIQVFPLPEYLTPFYPFHTLSLPLII